MIEEYSLLLPRIEHSASVAADLAAERDLATIVKGFSALLFRVAHSVLRNSAEAEDVVQDVFVRVLQFQHDAHRGSLSAVRDLRVWLVRIAWNLALDRRRRIRPEQMDELLAQQLPGREVAADTALSEAQQTRAVFREIDRLPKAERQALLLCALDELDHAEIARIMGRTESAIRALVFRARARLRGRLAKGEAR